MRHSFPRFLLSLLAITAGIMVCAQSLTVGGYKAVHDLRTGVWLCSVPREVFGTDWSTTVATDSLWTVLTVDNIEVADSGQVVFQAVDGGKNYPFTAMDGEDSVSGHITFTWLPVLELNGTFGYEYMPGTVSLNVPDSASSKADMLAKLKWRGGITNVDGKHKRNYHIKFVDENGEKKNRRLLGMRKDNHWKLDAGQMDPLRVRNRVCADLWLDMSRKPWHYELDSTVVNGSHGEMTEVFLNGEYYGIYGLIEPVDRKQLGLVKYDTLTHEFRGQQWVSKHKYPTYTFPVYNNYSDTWNGNEVNYPEVEDVFPTDWSTLYNAFEFARRIDAVDDWQTLTDSVAYYFDMPVMEDYFIFIVAMQALDNEVKNIYYSCYDKTLGGPRLTMTPWDLDISVGAKIITGLEVSPERPLNWIMHLAMGDSFGSSTLYRKEIINRYWQLRGSWLSTESLVNRFTQAIDDLVQCGAVSREEARWSGDSDLGGKTLDMRAELNYVTNWIERRMKYLDENVFVRNILRGDVNDDGVVNTLDLVTLIGHLLNGSSINELNTDVNGDGSIAISDVVALIELLMVNN